VRTDEDIAEAAEANLALGRISRQLRRARGPSELGVGTLSALATLVRCGPLRLGDLAAREQVAAPTMSCVIAGLESAGYVQRDADPADGRARLLAATGQGEQLVTGLTSERTRVLAARLDRLTPQQRRGLLTGLRALEQTFTED
jgi:DNA-binding MarR family transcriptional regulator